MPLYASTNMGYEVEVKYRLVDHDQLTTPARGSEAPLARPAIAPGRHLPEPPLTRLRRHQRGAADPPIGDENRITYKGPRLSGPTKTREEIEIVFAAGTTHSRSCCVSSRTWDSGRSPRSANRRTPFHLTPSGHDVEVALDRAEGLGDFAEIETLAATEADLPAAQAAVLAVAEHWV